MPEPASSTEKPPGAGRMASASVLLPVKTSCSVILGYRFSTTSRLASPRSASSTSTLRPARASAAARLAETKVLPTPPLPLVTAMILAKRAARCGHSWSWNWKVSNSRRFSSLLTTDTVAVGSRRTSCAPGPWPGKAAGRRAPATAPAWSAPTAARKAPPTLTVTRDLLAAGTEHHRHALDAAAHALGHGLAEGAGAVGQDDGEFLAAHPCHQVHRAHAVDAARCATALITWSPAAWPQVSLTRLKWSMSMPAAAPVHRCAPRGRLRAPAPVRRRGGWPGRSGRRGWTGPPARRSVACIQPGLPGSPAGGFWPDSASRCKALSYCSGGSAGRGGWCAFKVACSAGRRQPIECHQWSDAAQSISQSVRRPESRNRALCRRHIRAWIARPPRPTLPRPGPARRPLHATPHVCLRRAPRPATEQEFTLTAADFERVRQLIYKHAGISLHAGKQAMVYSRLSRRLRETRFGNFGDYLGWLERTTGAEAEPSGRNS
jgi:hypothetical protein